jgi:hypothetical protein
MAQNLFSSTLPQFVPEVANHELISSLNVLKSLLNKRSLKILQWDEGVIAIPINVQVELPPLGNFQGIDIRCLEPVLLVIDVAGYPAVAPKVYPDRIDFPKDQLAHLYVARKDKPPGFCLVRGDLDEWYSDKQINDLVIRISNWLRDAAVGLIAEDGNQFDPVRLEGYSGLIVYDYDQLAEIVNQKKAYHPSLNFAIGLFERNSDDIKLNFKLSKLITQENFEESFEYFKKEKEKAKTSSKKIYHFGYIIWSNELETFNNYSVDLPSNWEEFKSFCVDYGIKFENLEKQIAEYDLNTYIYIPIIVAIKRPKTIIGFSGDVEFFNFYFKIDTEDVNNGKIINNIPIKFQSHRQPLKRQRAKEISGFNAELGLYSLIAGCGALGSKIVMHLARSGSTSYAITDPDVLFPHNLVRHAASADCVGMGKAAALKKEISAIYPNENLMPLLGGRVSGKNLLTEDLLKLYSWIFDFTASNSFLQTLVTSKLESHTQICRAYLSNFGELGILLFEGKERNPRLDDLQVMLYAQYREKRNIVEWLQNEKNNIDETLSIKIGVGCNSETIKLSDDIVSLHAALFSGAIKSESHKTPGNVGRIYLNQIKQEPFFSNCTDYLEIDPMTVLQTVNDPTWQIRLKPGLVEEMKKEMGFSMPHETGGVFVGRANHKTKTLHVVELIKAPSDSKSNPVCFFRGIEGLPETIKEITEFTGNQLGYIGEWHTHPFGPNEMSNIDMKAVRKFKNSFEVAQLNLPVFLMIITPTHVLPYVF